MKFKTHAFIVLGLFVGVISFRSVAFAAARYFELELANPASAEHAGSITKSYIQDQYITDDTSRHSRRLTRPSRQLVVKGFDKNGQLIDEAVVRNPFYTDIEVFDGATGHIEHAEVIEHDSGAVRFSFHNNDAFDHIKVYQPVNGSLVEIDHLVVGDNTVSRLASNRFSALNSEVKPVMYNGDPDNRSDLVLVAEGYTQNEIGRFAADARRITQGYFEYTPYDEYQDFFNVWRIDAVSNVSGAGRRGVGIGTKFDATFNCNGIDRLLCVNQRKVLRYVDARMDRNQADQILVVVNTTKHGGAGGAIATMSLANTAIGLALHEVAHSYAGLADEYTYGSCSRYDYGEANSTPTYGGKWAYWQGVDNISWYDGGRYCATGMYRPTYDSMMRTLGRPFYAVNNEALILKTYEYVDAIDAVSPSSRNVRVDGAQTFSIETVSPRHNSVSITWSLNGRTIGRDKLVNVKASELNGGSNRLTVTVDDNTPRVRRDPSNLTKDTHTWSLTRGSDSDCQAVTVSPKGVQAENISVRGFTARWNAVANAVRYQTQLWNEARNEWVTQGRISSTNQSFSNLKANGTEYFRVRGINACNEVGPYNEWITVKLEGSQNCQTPDKPEKPVLRITGKGSFQASWPISKNSQSYQTQLWNVEWRDYTKVNETSATVSGLRANDLEDGIAYFRVIGINACGAKGAPSSWASLKIDLSGCSAPPAAPSDIALNGRNVQWSEVADADVYVIQSWDGSTWSDYAETIDNFMAITSSSPYYIRVRAKNACGQSTGSEWLQVRN